MPGTNSPSDVLREALGLHRAGRLTEAEAVYRRVLSSQPQSFDALHFLGILNAQRGDMADAVALISKALQIRSDEPFAHFHIAGAFAALGRKDEALASYDCTVALKPDFAEAHNNRGSALKLLKRYERAAGHPIHLIEDAAYLAIFYGMDFETLVTECTVEVRKHYPDIP